MIDNTSETVKLGKIAECFDIAGKFEDAKRYGEGHINVTYLVTTAKRRYILQKMNTYVFRDPDALMNNICAVTAYLENRGVETLHVVKTRDGKPIHKEDGECWRMYDFIENAFAYQSNIDAQILKKAGAAFGGFMCELSDFDASVLTESISRFHDTPKRFADFKAALAADSCNRAMNCGEEISFFLERENTFGKVAEGLKSGEIPLRVTHNDTKLNNILMDKDTGEARAIIDLDTVMPGSLLCDFGDSIRFGASTAAEDEEDLGKVHFSLELFEAYAQGYVGAVKSCITKREAELLPYGAYLLTSECGMRFLGDYLDGDKYFAVHKEGHNLIRARTQIKLAAEMWEKQDDMARIIAECMK